MVQEVLLPPDDGVADLHDGLLALLDVLDELNGGFIPLFDVIANIFFGGFAVEQLFVAGVEAELGNIVVVQDAHVFVALLDEGDVGLDEARLHRVVAQPGPRVERADQVHRLLHGLERAVHALADFLELLVLELAQVFADDHDGVGDNQVGLVVVRLLLVEPELRQQAFAEIARGHADRVHLLNDSDALAQVGERKAKG